VKGCASFAVLFLVGVGLLVSGMIYGAADLQDPGPGPQQSHERERERDLARKLGVAGVAVAFSSIFGAAGWGFYHRTKDVAAPRPRG
jgi:hypothetical protein